MHMKKLVPLMAAYGAYTSILGSHDTDDKYSVEFKKTEHKPSKETIEKLEALAKAKRESKKKYKQNKHKRKR